MKHEKKPDIKGAKIAGVVVVIIAFFACVAVLVFGTSSTEQTASEVSDSSAKEETNADNNIRLNPKTC